MKMDETEYTELYMELEKYEKRGIDMLLDGYQASPLQIVTAHMVKEVRHGRKRKTGCAGMESDIRYPQTTP